jgi:hypothetical protein
MSNRAGLNQLIPGLQALDLARGQFVALEFCRSTLGLHLVGELR